MSFLLGQLPSATPAMIEVWSDDATLRHALRFEIALAQADADEGLIPQDAADAIAEALRDASTDIPALAAETAHAGTLAIALVKRLRSELPSDIARHLHRGATSQDLADTVMALQIREAMAALRPDLTRIDEALRTHAETTATLPALGRTLLQDALPISFGMRIAQWHAGITFAGKSLARDVEAGAFLQFGGAVGSRAGLNGKGAAVAQRLARALDLPASAPWHADRTRIASIAASLGVLIGALAKMARDISLLSQNAIGEAREPAGEGRGGSSAMAHKRNPTGCQVALSAAMRSPGLVSTILAAMPGELERGLGGWQAEAPVLADLFLLAAGSASAMAEVAEGLEIDEAAIAANLARADLGDDIGDSAAITAELLSRGR